MEKVNREAVRILVADIGYQEASRRTGIAYATLRQWAKRGKWNVTPCHATAIKAVTNVTDPIAVAHARTPDSILAKSRIRMAQTVLRSARSVKSVPVRSAGDLRHLAETAAKLGPGWERDAGSGPAHFTLNMLNVNALELHAPSNTSTRSEA